MSFFCLHIRDAKSAHFSCRGIVQTKALHLLSRGEKFMLRHRGALFDQRSTMTRAGRLQGITPRFCLTQSSCRENTPTPWAETKSSQ
jgi:hypothetical protein